MMKNYANKFITITVYLVIFLFIVFTIRLYQLQIIKGKQHRNTTLTNRVKVIRLPAPRGIVYDRNGIALAKNKPYFFASFMPVSEEIDIEGLSKLLKIERKLLEQSIKKRAKNIFEPIKLKERLSFKEVTEIEARRSDYPGLIIETNISRNYVYNNTASHLLGYLGKPGDRQLKKAAYKDITPDTFVGQTGVEALYDEELIGVPGKKIVEVDALGRQMRVLNYIPPEKGKDITLSLDVKLQKVAEEAFGENAGSLVAINTENGEILVMASMPAYNPNDFIPGIDYTKWNSLSSDEQHPLLNRSMQSAYPPGSIFKALMAVAGMKEGVITPSFNIFCDGSMEVGSHPFRCWKSHGPVSFNRALTESCDLYFYEVGRKLGIDKIAEYAHIFGLGKKTGIGITRERRGVIPSREWKRKAMNKPWYLGETIIASIGQGYVSITPLQAALMTTLIANNGNYYPLTVQKRNSPIEPDKVFDIDPEIYNKVRLALRGVVTNTRGTGKAARSSIVNIAGKTGTAQVIGVRVKSELLKKEFRDHAWFISFAPYEKPEIALSVIVEHGGHGGSAAAPIAKKVIEAYIRNKS